MRFTSSNRVVVTGVGVLAANGSGAEEYWRSLAAGESGISRITRFDASSLKSQIAGEVKNFDPSRWLEPSAKAHKRARHTQFALAATKMALDDAKLNAAQLQSGRPLPVYVGVGSSSFEMIAESGVAVEQKGPRAASTGVIMEATPHSVNGAIADYLRVPTAARTFSSACAAGMDAIAEAAEIVRRGETDLVLAGGTDSPISMVPFANFDKCGMASRANEEPSRASRPFDKRRDSGVISEGCGMLVIENLDSALARGAQPYLEIIGSGVQTDTVDQPCSGFEFSMQRALANASLLPTDIDYICAWGPSHPVIDVIETNLIKKVFGSHAYRLAVSSIKGVTGNPLAAAGPLMMASCCLAFKHNLIPPTANYEVPDPDCDLDYVPQRARPAKVRYAMLNGHGVGGANTSIVVARI